MFPGSYTILKFSEDTEIFEGRVYMLTGENSLLQSYKLYDMPTAKTGGTQYINCLFQPTHGISY